MRGLFTKTSDFDPQRIITFINGHADGTGLIYDGQKQVYLGT